MNFDAFSHGQIKSKLWLCEKLEPLLAAKSKITILGSWYNVLGFMLLIRNNNKFFDIQGIDVNPEATFTANKILNYWEIENNKIQNISGDANHLSVNNSDVIINCSVEHMKNTDWFYNIEPGKLICLQSSNMTDENDPWFIENPSTSLEEFENKFQLSETFFSGELSIKYEPWGYTRYMIIGIK